MDRCLVSWIGETDLKACEGEVTGDGPLLSTLKAFHFQQVWLLYSYPEVRVRRYLDWLATRVNTVIHPVCSPLRSPIDFGEIYQAANEALARVFDEGAQRQVSILLSPGTPAMQAVWILLGKTRYPVTFIQSSTQQGVQEVEIPFAIAAEFAPQADTKLTQMMSGLASPLAAFNDIVTANPDMLRLKEKAAILATRDVPALIMGDTGTGKELFARAIHNASPRASHAFVPLNCGAIPPELIDSVLFGHAKGAFTGATQDRKGVFEDADQGTLFLDEFGELPPSVQVRLLRVLQDGVVYRVGDNKPRQVNVRIIAATNRNLMEEVGAGRFREDLFYRVAVGVLNLPPLRNRHGDLMLLAERLLETINQEASDQPGYTHKKLSAGAKKVILNHLWPGNVRELRAVLLRASIWNPGDTIEEADVADAMLENPAAKQDILHRPLGNGFDIQGLTDELKRHYIQRALAETNNNRTKAAELLGLNNYQTLSNWMSSLGMLN